MMEKEYTVWLQEIQKKIREKMSWVSEKNADKLPYTTDENGNYDDRSDGTRDAYTTGLSWWTNGFWGGMMWLLYQDTQEEKYKDIAVLCEEKLRTCLSDFYGLHHDVGFMYMPTAVADYRITGSEAAKKDGLHAANLLAGRFNPVGKFIRAWNDKSWDEGANVRGWAIIDCMCNLSLLFWASEETGDPRFSHIAKMHADTVLEHYIRPDGSVIHIGEFDPETGAFLRSIGGQGYGEGSAWARGQGWAIYGFTNAYMHTGKTEYLDAAKRVAHYCIANIPESGIIPVDFRQPAEPAWEDSCGACVIASGLIDLAGCVPELEKELYLRAARKLLKTIGDKRADWSESCDAIVQNCSAAYHRTEHHFTMNYADYYFIEAIYKLLGKDIHMW